MYSNKPVLCVDFDGVVHSYISGWKGPRNIPDPPVPGALEFLANALDSFEVNIYSSRSRYPFARAAMKEWLRKEYTELAPDYWSTPHWLGVRVACITIKRPWKREVEVGVCKLVDKFKFPTKKPAASILLDDRAITFTGKFPSIDSLKAFKPWNKGGTSLQDNFDIAIKALKEIRNEQGKVCAEFEMCKHTSCQSSVASWFIATKALGDTVGIDETLGGE
jgi:hypothetical protein